MIILIIFFLTFVLAFNYTVSTNVVILKLKLEICSEMKRGESIKKRLVLKQFHF